MQAAALLAVHGIANDQVPHVDDVAQFANLGDQHRFLIQLLGLTVKDVKTVEGALQAQVGAHNAHITRHDGLHLLHRLRDEHHLLVEYGTLGVPVGNSIAEVDIADTQLLGSKLEIFKDKVELCIDHHGSNIGFAEAGVVVPSAAACAEIVKCVIEDMGVEIDSRIADAIFTGLTTDTGCFKYVSVTPATMRIAADMIEKGANSGMINRIMFDTKSRERIEAERLALDSMKFYFDNRIAVVFITKKLLEISGVEESEPDGIASIPRQIEGVLAGITIREKDNGMCRVSLRTVEGVDASKICSVFGGGGHKAAAGCSIEGTVEQAESKVVKAAQSVIEESL